MAPPLPEDVEALLRRLRLPHIRALAPDVVATAKAQRWEPVEVLRALFAAEAAGRERSALATRRAAAGFPTGKTFDAWKEEASSLPAPTQQALRTLEWVHRKENLVVCGPSGTGKTFLLEALGHEAVQAGRARGPVVGTSTSAGRGVRTATGGGSGRRGGHRGRRRVRRGL